MRVIDGKALPRFMEDEFSRKISILEAHEEPEELVPKMLDRISPNFHQNVQEKTLSENQEKPI